MLGLNQQPHSYSYSSRAASPAISVVVPAYNAMRFLPKAVESLRHQTFQDFETVIVNDGSQDDIEAWYAQLDADAREQIHLYSQVNQGTCRARNFGIQQSRGDLIAFLDADDVWLPQKLALQFEYLSRHPEVSLVYCWSLAVSEEGDPIGRIYAEHLKKDVWAGLLERNVISTPSVVLVRRECLEKVGYFDVNLDSFVEDKDLWLRIARNHTIRCLPEILVHKRRHSFNNSKRWGEMEIASYRVVDKALASPPPGMTQSRIRELKRRSCGEINQQMAWKPLQTDDVDIAASWRYLKKACRHEHRRLFSKETFKLLFAIGGLTLVGQRRYRAVQRQLAQLRFWLASQRLRANE